MNDWAWQVVFEYRERTAINLVGIGAAAAAPPRRDRLANSAVTMALRRLHLTAAGAAAAALDNVRKDIRAIYGSKKRGQTVHALAQEVLLMGEHTEN